MITAFRSTFVPGRPRTKGSLKPQQVRGGGGVLTGRVRLVDTPQSKRWRRTVAKHVKALGWAPIEGPCVVEAIFWFDPAEVGLDPLTLGPDDYPTHEHIGDLDKLMRNVLDALQVDDTGEGNGAEVFADDRQVVAFGESCKRWALTQHGHVAGMSLRVWSVGRVSA